MLTTSPELDLFQLYPSDALPWLESSTHRALSRPLGSSIPCGIRLADTRIGGACSAIWADLLAIRRVNTPVIVLSFVICSYALVLYYP